MKRILTGLLLLTLLMFTAAPIQAQALYGIPGLWFNGFAYGARWPTLSGVRDMSSGVISYDYQEWGINGNVIPGLYSVYGLPLQYTVVMTSSSRTFTIINEPAFWANGIQYKAIIFQMTDANSGFVPWNTTINNTMMYTFCCYPMDGRRHSIIAQYDNYKRTMAISIDNGPWEAPDPNATWGTGGPFQVGIANQSYMVGMDASAVNAWFPQQWTGFVGGHSAIFWQPYEGNDNPGAAIVQFGDANHYFNNLGYGGSFYPGSIFYDPPMSFSLSP